MICKNLQTNNLNTFSLEGRPFIELNKLMKIIGWCESGGRAGGLISEGFVTVNGEIELRKRCKLRPGQSVTFEKQTVIITE